MLNKLLFKTAINTRAYGRLFHNKKLDLYKLKITFKFISPEEEISSFKFNKPDYISGDFNISELSIQLKQAENILRTENILLI